MEEKSAVPAVATKRASLKTQSRFNDFNFWKHQLRENCYKRVREDRSRLIWRTRLSIAPPQSLKHKDLVRSALEDIVSDELKKINCSSFNVHPRVPKCVPEADDTLWEYDGLHDAYRGECEEMLLEMQRIFYEDLRAESTEGEPEKYIETWEDEEDEYLARAIYEHMQLNNEQVRKETWCPICKQGELQENQQLIHCTLCELKLSKSDEVNLDILQTRLAEAHIEHLDRGCRLKPKFCIETS